jgi:hypothetical protein
MYISWCFYHDCQRLLWITAASQPVFYCIPILLFWYYIKYSLSSIDIDSLAGPVGRGNLGLSSFRLLLITGITEQSDPTRIVWCSGQATLFDPEIHNSGGSGGIEATSTLTTRVDGQFTARRA